MLSTSSSLSLAVVGLQILGVAWAAVDFINPILGGGSMLNNGKLKLYLFDVICLIDFSSMRFTSWQRTRRATECEQDIASQNYPIDNPSIGHYICIKRSSRPYE